ncbi:hypothetical protein BJV77DRAFT_1031970 [Russula vinacea]|nr:hypothetical protein BJV77DRAFT_1031970 [Russula vinacea]
MHNGCERITTGDATLDEMLGAVSGGAGKTQLALQLSLLVQLPIEQGGLNGSACYLTTSTSLPTPRLIQLLHEHPLLAGSRCTLDNIQTSATKSLLIIDSLADVLLEDAKVSTATLADRSRNLSAIAAQLHALAATHQLAVVAINRVTDVGFPGELIYADHACIFGRADGNDKKSAALGLVWANQVNARIMLARTERRYSDHHDRFRYRHHRQPPAVAAAATPSESHDRKRQRPDEDEEDVVLVLVRRLTIVFSSVCAPASVDFIVMSRGVETLAKDLGNAPVPPPRMTMLTNVTPSAHALAANVALHPPPRLAEVSPLDVGSVVSDFRPPQPQAQPGEIPVGEVAVEEEDEDAYWREVDDFPFSGDDIDLVQDMDP